MKDELKSLKMGSGSTVCGEAITGMGRQSICAKLRKKNWKNSLQDSWAECEGEAGSQSSDETLDKGACFVL